jgi:hypothetical protein
MQLCVLFELHSALDFVRFVVLNFGKHKCRLEDSIKLDLSKVGCKGIDWTELAQDRVQWQEFLSAIFIKKIGSGMHRVSQNLVGEWG